MDDLDRRLKEIGDKLAEIGHDISVFEALLEEETDRVTAVNERRREILDAEVTAIVFHRPRVLAAGEANVPERVLDHARVEMPSPVCFAEEHEAPAEQAAANRKERNFAC